MTQASSGSYSALRVAVLLTVDLLTVNQHDHKRYAGVLSICEEKLIGRQLISPIASLPYIVYASETIDLKQQNICCFTQKGQ